MKPISYKGYTIEPTSGKGYQFWKQDQGIDMDNVYYAESVEDAEYQIMGIIVEQSPLWSVKSKGGIVESFSWLTDAVLVAERCGGVLLNEFQTI